MKNTTKGKNKICTLATLAIVIGFLVFLQSGAAEHSYQISILERSAIYAAVAVFMNLLTGLTGLFSPGQAGFMAIGAYVVAIFTTPVGSGASVYYINGISLVVVNIQLPIPVVLLLGRPAAVATIAPIGTPVLHLESDYLTIATLGFLGIIRTFIVAPMFGTITNGSYGLKSMPGFPNIFTVSALAALCIAPMAFLINSSYGRAFRPIREDKVTTQSMGINLFHYKEFSFMISPFFAGVGGETLVMFMRSTDSKTFQVVLTYDILLIMILDGIGSITGSVAGAFLVTADRELLRFSDGPLTIVGASVPLFRSGFRMVIFSILLMAVVLFYRRGIMGNNELSWDGLLRLI